MCAKFLQQMASVRPHTVIYRGESFAGFCQLLFDSLCTVDPRQPPTYLERQAVMARCKGCCESCGDIACEIDHHVPRGCFGKDSLGNYKGLCASCHKLKTNSCDTNRIAVEDSNPYTSRFNAETWKGFVLSRRPQQVVANLHKASDGPI